MTELDVSSKSVPALLKLYADVHEALRRRGLMRSSNAPTGDFAAFLFCKAFGWEQPVNPNVGYDAKDSTGTLYQIRGRRITRYSPSRELPALPDLKNRPFHALAAVLFNEDFTVGRAALIPIEVVEAKSSFSEHAKAWRFLLTDAVWEVPGVTDVTSALRKASE
jgi:hypothetical protein